MKYRRSITVKGIEARKIFHVDAESKEDAYIKFKNGEGEFIETEIDWSGEKTEDFTLQEVNLVNEGGY